MYRFDSYSVMNDTVTAVKGQLASVQHAPHDPPILPGEVSFDSLEQMLRGIEVR